MCERSEGGIGQRAERDCGVDGWGGVGGDDGVVLCCVV